MRGTITDLVVAAAGLAGGDGVLDGVEACIAADCLVNRAGKGEGGEESGDEEAVDLHGHERWSRSD